jgi:cytidine deaminase
MNVIDKTLPWCLVALDTLNINMQPIFQELNKIINNAYAPYSKFKVAAIVETNKGNFQGVNIENASYGNTICAERVAINNAISHGAKQFKTLYLLSSSTRSDITPCGSCLQVMNEFFKPNSKIIVFNKLGKYKTYTLAQLLPTPFLLKK